MAKHYKRGWGDFSKLVRFEVGDGSRIKFWYDVWCENQTLKVAFMMLFNIAHYKESSVVDHVQFSNDS